MSRRSRTARILVAAMVAVAAQAALPAGSAAATRATSAAAATRTVVDMSGRHVRIPVTVKRIANNYPALNEMTFMLGGAGRLAAIDDSIVPFFPLFATIYPRLKKVPTPFAASSMSVNAERLLATHPDVVFLGPSSTGLLPTMKRLGIPALVFAYFKDPAELRAGVGLVAKILGGRAVARARQFNAYYRANVRRVQKTTAHIPRSKRPTVYYTAGNPLQTEGRGSIVSAWMNEAGGRNVAEEHGINTAPAFANVSLETVLRWNPDIIVCRVAASRKAILGDPRWRNVAAVRHHRVYANPTGVFVWSVRSAESALQPPWAAKTFHPKEFARFDQRREVRNFYSRFYSYKLTGKQVSSILSPR